MSAAGHLFILWFSSGSRLWCSVLLPPALMPEARCKRICSASFGNNCGKSTPDVVCHRCPLQSALRCWQLALLISSCFQKITVPLETLLQDLCAYEESWYALQSGEIIRIIHAIGLRVNQGWIKLGPLAQAGSEQQRWSFQTKRECLLGRRMESDQYQYGCRHNSGYTVASVLSARTYFVSVFLPVVMLHFLCEGTLLALPLGLKPCLSPVTHWLQHQLIHCLILFTLWKTSWVTSQGLASLIHLSSHQLASWCSWSREKANFC